SEEGAVTVTLTVPLRLPLGSNSRRTGARRRRGIESAGIKRADATTVDAPGHAGLAAQGSAELIENRRTEGLRAVVYDRGAGRRNRHARRGLIDGHTHIAGDAGRRRVAQRRPQGIAAGF